MENDELLAAFRDRLLDESWRGEPEELLAAFAACTEQITRYYHKLRETQHCQNVNGLRWLQPALGIGFIPEEARDNIEWWAKLASIDVRRTDGERAYFMFMADGLTPLKLTTLTMRVMAETIRLGVG